VLVPRVWLIRVTVAPGITADCESLTVPAMLPVATCAAAGAPHRHNATSAATNEFLQIQLTMRASTLIKRACPEIRFDRAEAYKTFRSEPNKNVYLVGASYPQQLEKTGG
jgi:hypothetical protein